jgi:iron complex transport system substrate-binding protein
MLRFKLVLLWCVILGSAVTASPLRIVSLAPAITEILATLNVTSQIVGVSSDCDYPETIKGLPKVGAFLQPSLERIASLSPTLVLGMGQPDSPGFRQLQKNGTRVVLFHTPDKIIDIYNIIRQIGTLTNRKERAGDVIRALKDQVILIDQNRPTISPSVMVVIWHPPITVAAANTFIGDMIKRAGGNNVIGAGYIRYPHIERELMMYKNPTVIIVTDQAAADAVRKDVMFQLTPAARRGFIVSNISPDLLLRPGPRFPIAMRQLQAVFTASVPHE